MVYSFSILAILISPFLSPASRKPIKLTFEEYKQMATLLVIYMRKQEEEAEGSK